MEKHSIDEIVTAGRNAIGWLPADERKDNNLVKVTVNLKHKEDGVIYTYDVYFEKVTDNQGIIWKYVKYIPFTT